MKLLALIFVLSHTSFAMNVPKCPVGKAKKITQKKIIAYYCKKGKSNHGKFWTYFQNGNEFERGQYNQGKLHGRLQRYNENGNLEYSVTYKNGQKNGLEIYYSFLDDEVHISSKEFIDDKLDGNINLFYNNTRYKFKAIAKNGKLNGKYSKYFRFLGTAEEGNYKNGELDGLVKIFHPHGKLKLTASFRVGKPIGKITHHDIRGKEIKTENFTSFDQVPFYQIPGVSKLTGTTFTKEKKSELAKRALLQLNDIYTKEQAYKKKIGGFSSDLTAIGFEVNYKQPYYICGFSGPSVTPFPYPDDHKKGRYHSIHGRIKKIEGYRFPAFVSPEDLIGELKPREFVASCVGNIDEDNELDVWTIDETNEIKHVTVD